ncbi:hypothetical protein PYCCODRAFT_1436036 [Trametes coccinea BRFM310]|uniref:Uncharacterized protein n=1 Tax=Trametes coccinea (strain BRFM310) TaxID=1353009 RepID=A0A1Y2IP44_TRAC3|nr:hypothetical protein PYCCODRAFT_1436036 [Trametes coccinea BRFM310]
MPQRCLVPVHYPLTLLRRFLIPLSYLSLSTIQLSSSDRQGNSVIRNWGQGPSGPPDKLGRSSQPPNSRGSFQLLCYLAALARLSPVTCADNTVTGLLHGNIRHRGLGTST